MKVITEKAMAELLVRAAASTRKRMNLNLHAELTDPVNRFLNAGVAGTYVRPHRHRLDKWEFLSVLQGSVDVVFFAALGEIQSRIAPGPNGPSLIEIQGGEWHSIVFHAPSAVVLEVKPGPYEPHLDKDFAQWAPPEGDARALAFQSWLEGAMPGETWAEHADGLR